MRDKLIALIKEAEKDFSDTGKPVLDIEEHIADHLLANNVIVIHCKVGDTVYQTDGIRIYELDVFDVSLNLKNYKPYYETESIDFDYSAIGKSIFLTREEAEKALEALEDMRGDENVVRAD